MFKFMRFMFANRFSWFELVALTTLISMYDNFWQLGVGILCACAVQMFYYNVYLKMVRERQHKRINEMFSHIARSLKEKSNEPDGTDDRNL